MEREREQVGGGGCHQSKRPLPFTASRDVTPLYTLLLSSSLDSNSVCLYFDNQLYEEVQQSFCVCRIRMNISPWSSSHWDHPLFIDWNPIRFLYGTFFSSFFSFYCSLLISVTFPLKYGQGFDGLIYSRHIIFQSARAALLLTTPVSNSTDSFPTWLRPSKPIRLNRQRGKSVNRFPPGVEINQTNGQSQAWEQQERK